MLLRIEDTDRTRFVEGALENLLKALKWSGVEIDEGVMLDENGHVTEKGDFGPYIQSERVKAVSYTHLTLPTKLEWCRSRWSPYH